MLGIAALVCTAFVGLSYRQWEQHRRANAEAERSGKTIAAIDSVVTALESRQGERGFLLTGEDRYLQPYNDALQQIPSDLATLKNLLGGSQQGMQDRRREDEQLDKRYAKATKARALDQCGSGEGCTLNK